MHDLNALSELVASLARLFDSAERDDRFKQLHLELRRLCAFENFIVYLFDGASAPQLLGSNLPEDNLRKQMEDFVNGLFLLDPFVRASQQGVSGLLRLRDIMPDDFLESEFFKHHYTYTNLLDEVRYVVPVGGERAVHVFVEREISGEAFSNHELGLLKALEPMMRVFVQRRMRWLESIARGLERPLAAIDLRARIKAMAPGKLTNRECEIVELILRGHAAKSIGQTLGIEEGTVINHKRNIYAKLGIHSQAQLFNLFLQSIASI